MAIPEVSLYKKNDNFQNKFSHTFELINKINRFCEERLSCAFVLVIIPELLQIKPDLLNLIIRAYRIDPNDYNWLQPQLALNDFCIKNNIYCLDLLPIFKEIQQEEPLYFGLDIHWNARGHLQAANEIFKFIKKEKIFIGVQ
jgi:hypothetical protein